MGSVREVVKERAGSGIPKLAGILRNIWQTKELKEVGANKKEGRKLEKAREAGSLDSLVHPL